MRVLGLFAKQPMAGFSKTRLGMALGDTAAAELSEAFARDVTERMQQVGDRRWLVYSPATVEARGWSSALAGSSYEVCPQSDGDLGERMEEFFATAFIDGATSAVLIGSDSPTLPASLVEQAFVRLQSHDAVLGPAHDGGYYLIGLNQIWLGLLRGVRWSTPQALADTLFRLRCAEFRVALLPAWTDVDTPADLNALRQQLRQQRSEHPQTPLSHTERCLQRLGDGAAIP
jgi:rSAM/selenodomain-associated transferase 1